MGKPAARVGDMHTCPMVTPAVPPVPHVGGPLLPPGVINVLIGNMPAATIGNMCVCVGPPSSVIRGSTGVFIGGRPAARMGDNTAHGGIIVSGFPTVLIGEVGGGGGGGATGAGADAAGGGDSGGGWLDALQLGLDIVGLVPGLGEIADGINAVIYVARGDYANAALSVAAMIPIGGQAATAAKLGIKGVDAAKTAKKAKKLPVLSKSGKTAKQHAYEEMQKIVDKVDAGELGKRQLPESLEVAVNKKTGEILTGRNKTLNKGNPKPEIHKKTKDRFKEGDREVWNERNCSEADVAEQIHRRDENIEDYEFHAVEYDKRTKTIQDKHTCRNCDVNMQDAIERGDVTSNTPESLEIRNNKNKKQE